MLETALIFCQRKVRLPIVGQSTVMTVVMRRRRNKNKKSKVNHKGTILQVLQAK